MTTTMEWIKKNWMTIAIVALVIAVVIYFVRKNKKDNTIVLKLPKIPGLAGRGVAPAGESSAQVKAKLDECMKGVANVRIASNVAHPCAPLQDAYDKLAKAESSYEGELKYPLVDMATGQDGLAMLNM